MESKNMSDGKSDGLALVYVKDGTMYPVGLTQNQLDALELTIGIALQNKLKVFTDKPMGEVTSVL